MRSAFRYPLIAVGIVATATALAVGSGQRDSQDSADVLAQLATYRAELAVLKDRQQIDDLYARWGRGVDRLDEQAYFSTLWPDAQINYGTKQSLTPAEHWKQHMLGTYAKYGVTWVHILTNRSVEIKGDVAHVESYLTILAHWKDEKEASLVSGRYIDRLDRRNGEWRVVVREWVPEFQMKGRPGYDELWKFYNSEADRKVDCVSQHWGKWDTSYVRPLERRKATDGTPCAR